MELDNNRKSHEIEAVLFDLDGTLLDIVIHTYTALM